MDQSKSHGHTHLHGGQGCRMQSCAYTEGNQKCRVSTKSENIGEYTIDIAIHDRKIFSCFQTLDSLCLVNNANDSRSAAQKMPFSSVVSLTLICGRWCLSWELKDVELKGEEDVSGRGNLLDNGPVVGEVQGENSWRQGERGGRTRALCILEWGWGCVHKHYFYKASIKPKWFHSLLSSNSALYHEQLSLSL